MKICAGVVMALALAGSGSLYAQADARAAAAIMKTDRDFNQALGARDRARFLSFIAETATFVGEAEMRGHQAILKGWSPFFDPKGPTLTWERTSGEILVGGDVGVTIGSWIRRSRDAAGKPIEARGQYVTTWKKQKDGSWNVVYDIGSTAP
jgi:ketosteroid isomerase-like protein